MKSSDQRNRCYAFHFALPQRVWIESDFGTETFGIIMHLQSKFGLTNYLQQITFCLFLQVFASPFSRGRRSKKTSCSHLFQPRFPSHAVLRSTIRWATCWVVAVIAALVATRGPAGWPKFASNILSRVLYKNRYHCDGVLG